MRSSWWSILTFFLYSGPLGSNYALPVCRRSILLVPKTLAAHTTHIGRLKYTTVKSSPDLLFDFDSSGKEITTIEASLRLDAVASAGLGVSRTRMTKEINTGSVLVDGEKAKVVSTTVKEGQIVQAIGIGAVKIMSIATTAKGRFKIVCRRIKQSAPSSSNSN